MGGGGPGGEGSPPPAGMKIKASPCPPPPPYLKTRYAQPLVAGAESRQDKQVGSHVITHCQKPLCRAKIHYA